MTASAPTSSGVEDRTGVGGGSEDGGRPDDLAEDFLPISWSVHSTAPPNGTRDRQNMGSNGGRVPGDPRTQPRQTHRSSLNDASTADEADQEQHDRHDQQ